MLEKTNILLGNNCVETPLVFTSRENSSPDPPGSPLSPGPFQSPDLLAPLSSLSQRMCEYDLQDEDDYSNASVSKCIDIVMYTN